MVTIYTKDELKDLSGSVLKDGDNSPVTLGKVFINALLAPHQGDESLSGEEKLKRFRLAQRFFAEETANIESEEVVLLQKLVSKNYGVLVTGQILDWLK